MLTLIGLQTDSGQAWFWMARVGQDNRPLLGPRFCEASYRGLGCE